MVFRLSRTYDAPSVGAGAQRGYPAPGAGAQTTGPAPHPRKAVFWAPEHPTTGTRAWPYPEAPSGQQRGFPAPVAEMQARPAGSMPARPSIWGGVFQRWTPYYDRGAAAFAPNFGRTLTNPIGAGIVALHRVQASYGGAAQYANGALWWTSQAIPTTITPQSLNSPEELAALLSGIEVQAVIRTTG